MGRLQRSRKHPVRHLLVVAGILILICLVFSQGVATGARVDGTACRRILVPYYADPFKVDLSSMRGMEDLEIDDPADGIDWEKVYLPHPCVNADNKRTYIMVSRGGSNNLLIYLEGGGAATDFITYYTMAFSYICELLPPRCGIFDRKNPTNPFRDWTFVFIPYCTADVHAGNRVMKYLNPLNPKKSKVVYHVGYVNATVAIRWAAQQLPNPGKVVLAGSSAGGYGTLAHALNVIELFNKPVTIINDAGPGLTSKRNPNFTLEMTDHCWGFLQNQPEGVRQIILQKGEVAYGLEYFSELYDNSNYRESIYAFYEDKRDFVIGNMFLWYTGEEFEETLLKVWGELRDQFENNIFRFLPCGIGHTVLYGYPLVGSDFYTRQINGITVCEWVKGLLEGNPRDLVQNS
ncbi:MAG: pectin acetylesterase-family hydrolase [Candidatus Hadarchaeales archaeon]